MRTFVPQSRALGAPQPHLCSPNPIHPRGAPPPASQPGPPPALAPLGRSVRPTSTSIADRKGRPSRQTSFFLG